MATQADIDKNADVCDKRFVQGNSGTQMSTVTNYDNLTALDAALIAAAAGTYTQAYLDKMTKNDKVWALRGLVDSAGI